MDGSNAPRGREDLERRKRFVPFSFIINFIALEVFSRGIESEADREPVKAWVNQSLPLKQLKDYSHSPLENFFDLLSTEAIGIIIESLKNIKSCLTSREILERKNPLILVVDAHERINIIIDYL